MKKEKIDIKEGPIRSGIIRFALPVTFTLFLQLIANAVDTILIGNYGTELSLAAMGAATPIMNLFINAFLAFSSGASITIAQNIGLGDNRKTSDSVHTSVLVGLLSGVIIALCGSLLARPTMISSGCPENIIDAAVKYMRFYYLSVPSTALYYFCASVFRAKGDTKKPLYILLGTSALHIALSTFFMVYMRYDLIGISLSTFASMTLAAIILVIMLTNDDSPCQLNLKKLRISFVEFKRIISVGIPAMIQSICMTYSNVVIQSAINSFGTDVISGATAANSVLNLLVNPVSEGIVQATVVFVSQAYGGKRYKRIKDSLYSAYLIGFVLSLSTGVLTTVFAKPLLRLYTSGSNLHIIETGFIRVWVECLSYFLCTFQGTICSAMRGINYSIYPLLSTAIGTCLFRWLWIATAFKAKPTLVMLYMCYPVSWLVTFAWQQIVFNIKYRKLLKDSSEEPDAQA